MNNLKKKATLSILLMVSMGHLLNDMFQSVIPSIYPIIKESLGLSFMQIGAITLTNQITASLLQLIAVCAAATLLQHDVDDYPCHSRGNGDVLSHVCHPRLWHGTAAWQCRYDLWSLLRTVLRLGRHRLSPLRMDSRPDQHPVCVPAHGIPAPAWHRCLFPAKYQGMNMKKIHAILSVALMIGCNGSNTKEPQTSLSTDPDSTFLPNGYDKTDK